jgi:hypothetical protein
MARHRMVSNQKRGLNRELCNRPWAIFREVAVMTVGKVKAEKAG